MPCQPEVWTSRPMAQTKPASSRATATTALFFMTRRASRRLNFAFSRNCAAQAMSVTALGSRSWRVAMDGAHARAVLVVPGDLDQHAPRRRCCRPW